ncbi:MAG: hypothetical protein WED07_03100 [Candidatus Freyarchaeum deiterrae]
MDSEPDSQNILLTIKIAAEETAKLFGPIFIRMMTEFALKFEAEKLKEKQPENIQGLEEVINYIIANLDRYPLGYNAFCYGVIRADSELQGASGSGSRRAAYGGMKTVLESSGLLNSLIGATEDIFEADYKAQKTLEPVVFKAVKTAFPPRHIRGENNQAIIIVPNCMYKDACDALLNEGILRRVGGVECIYLSITIFGPEIITKKHLDYKLDECGESECRGKIFEV